MADAIHAQCGAHLIRHLHAIAETPAFAGWANDMADLLLEAKAAAEAALAAGYDDLDADTADSIETRYHRILDTAFGLSRPGRPPAGVTGAAGTSTNGPPGTSPSASATTS